VLGCGEEQRGEKEGGHEAFAYRAIHSGCIVMRTNGRFGKEPRKILIALSCAIVRMKNKHQESVLTRSGLPLKRRIVLSVALQKGYAMTRLYYDNVNGKILVSCVCKAKLAA
jgi:hypothetical protein